MKIISHLVLAILFGFFFIQPGCTKTTATPSDLPEGFYRYSRDELNALIVKTGIEGFDIWPQSVERNSSGTILRLGDIWNNPIVAMSCDGSISTIDIQSRTSWLNDDNEVIAWYHSGVVHYSNGYSETSNIVAHGGADPSGRYFYKNFGGKKVGVFSIRDPEHPLIVLDAFRLRLYTKDDKIHIFAQKSGYSIDAYFCNIKEGELKVIEEFQIDQKPPQPFPSLSVVDYNINTGDLVILDSRDWPSKSKWYLYNNRTKEYRKIGRVPNRVHGLFTDCDIVEAVSAKLESDKKKPLD